MYNKAVMLDVKLFNSLEEAKEQWLTLEKRSSHYPFQAWWYQNLFVKHFSNAENLIILGVFADEILIAIGAFEKVDDVLMFLGTKKVLNGQDISDFGDILISNDYQNQAQVIWSLIIDHIKTFSRNLQLSFIREDSVSYQVLKEQFTSEQIETSPYIYLSNSWEEYLHTLNKKDRHELERKIRRFEREVKFELCKEETVEHEFNEFVRLHKLSTGDKAEFMTNEMKDFFWDMLQAEKHTWQTHLCSLTVGDKTVASVFLFISEDSVLLYNSAFDPEYRKLSVGLVMHAYLIKKAIADKKKIYDFLRGNERYKYDLGAKNLPLYSVSIELS